MCARAVHMCAPGTRVLQVEAARTYVCVHVHMPMFMHMYCVHVEHVYMSCVRRARARARACMSLCVCVRVHLTDEVMHGGRAGAPALIATQHPAAPTPPPIPKPHTYAFLSTATGISRRRPARPPVKRA